MTDGERRAAERRLILSYAPAAARDGAAALMMLDDALGQVLRTTREPMVGQMRLTWWHEALLTLGSTTVPAEPVLRAIAAEVLPKGATPAMLARLVEGWEVLLEPLDFTTVERAAEARGEALFGALAIVLGANDPRVQTAGRAWAMADLARGLSDPVVAAAAAAAAGQLIAKTAGPAWPRRLRMIGALVVAARYDLDPSTVSPASPRRVGRLLYHRLTGR